MNYHVYVLFLQLLAEQWRQDAYAATLGNRKVIVVSEGSAHLLSTNDGKTTLSTEIESLRSSQEENDFR